MAELLDITPAINEAKQLKDIEDKARTIYQSGNALRYIADCCEKLHPGKNDKRIITAGILAVAATYCPNSYGLHIYVAGRAGSGKTHVINTLLKHIPKDRQISGHFSDKALFYLTESGRIKQGTVIHMDDQDLTETSNNILKAQTSEWNEEYALNTVIDKKGVIMHIPPRCPRIVTKADYTGDEQTADRQLCFFADDSDEQKQLIRKLKADLAANPRQAADTTLQQICRTIWSLMPNDQYVSIPYAHRIIFTGDDSLRNTDMLHSLIYSACIMAAPRREKDENGCLIATEEDFRTAACIMNPILAGNGGSQKLKLSPNQQIILDWLKKQDTDIYPYQVILDELKIPAYVLTRAMNGRNDYDSEGLLKIPGIFICTDTYGTRKNEKCVAWNKEVYESWEGSKAYVTLEPPN